MRMLSRPAENPSPTHDAARDIGRSSEARFNYDLTSGEDAELDVQNSRGRSGVRIGRAEREDHELIEPTATRLVARSGNAHWDGDDDEELASGDELGLQEDRSGPDPGIPFAVVASAVGLGLLVYLLTRKDR